MRKPSRTQWDRIDKLKDEEIDFSDNPEIDAGFLTEAFRWPGPKELISLRLDREVLAFFRRQGKGYQTTINTLLRRYMEAQVQQLASHRSEKRARKK
jgi:uncharacterized protein (DUF4415 family)